VKQYALTAVSRESIKLYTAINDATINLVDKFFKQLHEDRARSAFPIWYSIAISFMFCMQTKSQLIIRARKISSKSVLMAEYGRIPDLENMITIIAFRYILFHN